MTKYIFINEFEGYVDLFCCMNCFEYSYIQDSEDVCPVCGKHGMLIEADIGISCENVFAYKLIKIEE